MSRTTATLQQPSTVQSIQGTHTAPEQEDRVLQGIARGDRQGVLKLRGIPTFSDLHDKRAWIRQHMAAVFRFFAKRGYTEGTSGHISVRGKITYRTCELAGDKPNPVAYIYKIQFCQVISG